MHDHGALQLPKNLKTAVLATENTENAWYIKIFAFHPVGDIPTLHISLFPLCDLCDLCGKILFTRLNMHGFKPPLSHVSGTKIPAPVHAMRGISDQWPIPLCYAAWANQP